jgi:phosphoribosylformimino-5-aminoimidazole carboxamide ribotide isomerase
VELYCAVDIMGGTAVRLRRGDFEERTDHGDPVELALRYVSSGARYLHVVDLDAARKGAPLNRDAVLRIVEKAGVPVQVGGGARSFADAAGLLEAGAERVVLGTAAVEDPGLVEALSDRYPMRIAIGIDHGDGGLEELGGTVAVHGWERSGAVTVGALLDRFAGAPLAAVVVTSIARDGMMSGPDTAGLTAVLARSALPVIASGGVRSASDLRMLAELSAGPGTTLSRLAGVVVGKALADGSLEVKEAIAACEPSG